MAGFVCNGGEIVWGQRDDVASRSKNRRKRERDPPRDQGEEEEKEETERKKSKSTGSLPSAAVGCWIARRRPRLLTDREYFRSCFSLYFLKVPAETAKILPKAEALSATQPQPHLLDVAFSAELDDTYHPR